MLKRGVLVVLILVLVSHVSAREIVVNPGESIQSAVDSASSGDTILVKAGDYSGRVTVSKSGITIKSDPRRAASVDGGFLIAADNIVIEGFEITSTSSGAAIYARPEQASNIKILDNYIYKPQAGIHVTGENWLIENNEIDGLKAYGSTDCDYTRFHGNGHTFRHNLMHNARESDVGGAHVDCFQTYYGPTRDITIEYNLLLRFLAGSHLRRRL
jgi:hypothetical protein